MVITGNGQHPAKLRGAGSVGVGNAAVRIHEQDARTEAIERGGKRGGLRRLELDEPSDQHSAAKMRNQ